MRRINFHAMFAIVVSLCLSSAVLAQNSSTASSAADKYLISAKAGGENYVDGTVTITRAAGTSGVLLKRDRVEIGDRVSTGADGRAEVLLNPGSYIRLGKNSSFEFGSTDLEDLRITLESGSAMFEVFAADEFRVSVFTPKGKLALIDTGIYRVDVSTDGSALLAVSKGKAEVGDDKPTLIKGGRTGTVGTDTVAVTKFDKDKRDDLGEWSKTRSKELGKITNSFRTRDLTTLLGYGFSRGAWGFRDSFGLWMYSPQFGYHCFIPFGNGWRSPYGWWYDRGISWYNFPPIYYPPVNTGNPSTRKIREDVAPIDPRAKTSRGVEPTRGVDTAPPFTKINRGGHDDGSFGGGLKMKNDDSWMRSSPSSSPTSFPPVSAPVSVPSTGKIREIN